MVPSYTILACSSGSWMKRTQNVNSFENIVVKVEIVETDQEGIPLTTVRLENPHNKIRKMKDMKLSQKIYIENSLKSKNLITILLSALNSGRQNHLP